MQFFSTTWSRLKLIIRSYFLMMVGLNPMQNTHTHTHTHTHIYICVCAKHHNMNEMVQNNKPCKTQNDELVKFMGRVYPTT